MYTAPPHRHTTLAVCHTHSSPPSFLSFPPFLFYCLVFPHLSFLICQFPPFTLRNYFYVDLTLTLTACRSEWDWKMALYHPNDHNKVIRKRYKKKSLIIVRPNWSRHSTCCHHHHPNICAARRPFILSFTLLYLSLTPSVSHFVSRYHSSRLLPFSRSSCFFHFLCTLSVPPLSLSRGWGADSYNYPSVCEINHWVGDWAAWWETSILSWANEWAVPSPHLSLCFNLSRSLSFPHFSLHLCGSFYHCCRWHITGCGKA